MGKSIELLGLAAFNIFIAIVLSTPVLSKSDAAVSSLTESNVERFINEMAQVSGGLREDMDAYSITGYFMNHIADGGVFKTRIAYDLPDMPTNEREHEMDKLNFISHVLQDTKSMERHETAVKIEHIKIVENGRRAQVMTTNYERGVMPIADGYGEPRMVPVTGTSYCEQDVVLSGKNIIQVAGVNCSTNIDFAESY